MAVALILLSALLLTGTVLYIEHRLHTRRKGGDVSPDSAAPAEESGADDGCCGMHITCERDSLLASVSDRIVYYDDEELDRFAGRTSDSYEDAEIEEFRDVLLTMLPEDIAGWGRSLQLRGIELPEAVRDELLMIVSEARAAAVRS